MERFKATEQTELKKELAPNGEKIIVHISNFRKVKRVPVVIQIFVTSQILVNFMSTGAYLNYWHIVHTTFHNFYPSKHLLHFGQFLSQLRD